MTPIPPATATAKAAKIAKSVDATLTAQPTATATLSADQTATVEARWQATTATAQAKISSATATADAEDVATASVATLTALAPTMTHTPTKIATPRPTPTLNARESGLIYEVLKEGNGLQPQVGDIVQVHYTGQLEDGTEFDSSRGRGEPIQFPLGRGQVIPGWDEGIGLMNVGTVVKLIIPPDLAYGERGAGGAIPPNATLIFDIELLDIQ